jgi:hypothetical protein
LTITALFLWASSLTRGRVCLVYAAGSRQRSLSWVRVPLDSDLRLPFSSPLTTRRVTVEVFDPVSTQGLKSIPESESQFPFPYSLVSSRHGPRRENAVPLLLHGTDHIGNTCHVSDCELIGPLAALGVARTT